MSDGILKEAEPVRGHLLSINFTTERKDGLFVVVVEGSHQPEYLVLGKDLDSKFTANGVNVSYPELMSWLVGSTEPVTVTLHPVLERYMAVLQAEFTRAS